MIFLECYNDEALVRGLGVPRRGISHEPGKSLVADALLRWRNQAALGLVDQDPGAAPTPYFKEFKMVEELPKLRLALYQHPLDNKRLVEIQPDLEPWLYEAARGAGLNPKDHHLPEKHGQLHDQPRTYSARVTAFVAELLKARSPHMLRLQQWLVQP